MAEPGPGEQFTGAQSLVKSLEQVGAETVFGIPGGAILPAYDPLYDSATVRHILVRHEQGAGHAAEGYAMVTGKVGVCMATSGPGATNLVTPIADAHMDSVPMVAITGQVAGPAIGTDAFQEADITGITMPITKHNFLVRRPEDIPNAIASAFHIASTGRPGPVLVDITKDALQASSGFSWPTQFDLPGYRPVTKPHGKQVKEAARLILAAKRPVLYVGGGVAKAGAARELRELVELTGIPVVTTLMALGVFPDSHPLNLGMPGMHGTVASVGAIQRSDLLISLGARFDDRVTGQLSSFAPNALVVHADIDPAEISKNRHADVPIVGDCKEVIAELVALLRGEERHVDVSEWLTYVSDMKNRYPTGFDQPTDGSLSPQHVIKRIGELTGPEAYYAAGVGQHQMWAAHYLPFESPGHWLNSGGLGTMGYCVPAAMGAKVGKPDSVVWGIDGDGCFQMTNQELVTCALEGIPVKIAVINNQSLGMVRQWQTLFYEGRYSNTDLKTNRIPDFPKLAEAMGCVGLRAETADDVDPVIEKALATNDAPVVVEFVVNKDAMVWPMVAAGSSNDAIKYARDLAPNWDDEASEPVSTHTLSVLVENKPGVLARIASLISRRGFNIDSLAVGPTEHPEMSRITLVVDVDDLVLEQLTKQLNKLIEVLKIVELETAVRRELVLVKVRCEPEARSQILEIVNLFRAKAVDISNDSITVEATGGPDKLEALLDMLAPYGIRELVQSGLVAIGRGSRSITDRSTRADKIRAEKIRAVRAS